MVTKGWKQKKHKRTSKTGKSFTAGSKISNETYAKADAYTAQVYSALTDAGVDFEELGRQIKTKGGVLIVVDIYNDAGITAKKVYDALNKTDVPFINIGENKKQDHAFVDIDLGSL